jgi:hypothetical protein
LDFFSSFSLSQNIFVLNKKRERKKNKFKLVFLFFIAREVFVFSLR